MFDLSWFVLQWNKMFDYNRWGVVEFVTKLYSFLLRYYDFVTGVTLVIVVFVGIVIVVFRGYGGRKAMKKSWAESKVLELGWTVIPTLILCVLSLFSLDNLYAMELGKKIDYRLKVIGHQWNWEYEYFLSNLFFQSFFFRWLLDSVFLCGLAVDNKDYFGKPSFFGSDWSCSFSSNEFLQQYFKVSDGLEDLEERKEVWTEVLPLYEGLRRREVTYLELVSSAWESLGEKERSFFDAVHKGVILNQTCYARFLVEGLNDDEGFISRVGMADCLCLLPYDKVTSVSVTTGDVLHRWSVPALAFKMDAVIGRTNTFSLCPEFSGVFSGNCFEMCGLNHSSMPISLLVSHFDRFECFLWKLFLQGLDSNLGGVDSAWVREENANFFFVPKWL